MLLPLRLLRLAGAAVLVLTLLGAQPASGEACPSLATKASLGAVKASKPGTLTVKVKNIGSTTATGVGVAVALSPGASYRGVAWKPKSAAAGLALIQENNTVAWTGLTIAAKRSVALRVKLDFNKCAFIPGSVGPVSTYLPKHNSNAAKDTTVLVGIATFTGTVVPTFTGTTVQGAACVSATIESVRGR